MARREKRLETIRNNPRGVRPEELEQVLIDAGFNWDFGKGDHRVYRHPNGRRFSLDFGRNPVRRVYVEAVLALLSDGSEES